MSIESANASRYGKGLMVLSELEGDLLDALELLWKANQFYDIDHDSKIAKAVTSSLAKAYGDTP